MDKGKEKLPPQDTGAEQSVLGCLMIDKNAVVKVSDFLRVNDFYKIGHQRIYACILDLFSSGEPVDLVSVASALKSRNELEGIGGESYLTELINSVPNALHVATYGKIVQKKRILRELIEASYEIGEMGYNEVEDPQTLMDHAEKRIFRIAQGYLQQKFIPIHTVLAETFDRVDQLTKQGGIHHGTPTGFKDLDNMLAGLHKSDLIILAARPSLGKSSLALDIARNVAVSSKVPVGIFSLEMSTDQVTDRIIAAQGNVDLWRMRTGKMQEMDFVRLQNAMDILSDAPIYINDTPSINALQIKALARRLQAEHGLGLIVIDYLQLMETTNPNYSVVQQVSEISRSLKILARELNVPILALSQLSRAVEQRIPPIPRLSDLRESGSLEQDADIVMFIYREDKYRQNTDKKNIAQIIIAKHRHGPTGYVDLYFNPEKVSFGNLDKSIQTPEPMGAPSDFNQDEIDGGFPAI